MSATAKLFMLGKSQIVRLPEEFRLPGTEVRVTRVGHKIVLEPLETRPFDIDMWWAQLDALGAAEFVTQDLPADAPVKPDGTIDFG